jgi:hypothetical protein
MKKPKMNPITISLHSSFRKIVIEALTDEAMKWVETNAKEFGNLLAGEGFPEKRGLWVYEGYNASDVAAYLIELWDAEHGSVEEWPEEVGEEIAAKKERE